MSFYGELDDRIICGCIAATEKGEKGQGQIFRNFYYKFSSYWFVFER